jgi:hypothetical protein
VVVQSDTNYVDGLLASALLIQLGAALAWMRTRDPEDLLILIAGFIVATNLKFTGLVYSSVLFVCVVAFVLINQRKISRSEIIVSACGIAALIVVSSQTYLLNLIEQGHPFYPINKIDVIGPNMNHEFLALPRFEKFFDSTFSIPSNSSENMPIPELFVPRLWHYYTLTHGTVDGRVNGFGSLFGWSLLASVGGLLACLFSETSRIRLKRNGPPVLLLLAGTLASAILNPEFWWARYAPQLWLVPILVSAFVFMAGRRYLASLLLVPVLAGSVLFLVFWVSHTVHEQHRIHTELARIAKAGYAEILNGWNHNDGVFTFAYREQLDGVDVRLSSPQSVCSDQVSVGIVATCHAAR